MKHVLLAPSILLVVTPFQASRLWGSVKTFCNAWLKASTGGCWNVLRGSLNYQIAEATML